MVRSNSDYHSDFAYLKKRKLALIMAVLIAVIVLLMVFIYSAYNRHKDIVVEQQKDHLLSIAQTVARNIEFSVEEKTQFTDIFFDEFSSLAGTSGNEKGNILSNAVEKLYSSKSGYFSTICLLDTNGQILFRQGTNDDIPIQNYVNDNKGLLSQSVERKRAVVGPVFLGSGQYCLLGIVKPVFMDGNLNSYVFCAVSLDKVYEDFVAPIRVGERGYILIKDRTKRIIMYKAKEQIGIDVVQGRKEKYPSLYYKDLEDLIDRQMAGETGTAVYYSYWWTEKNIPKVQKINAFCPVSIGDSFWVISVEMDYKEIETPVKNNLNNILLLSFIILVILSYAVFIIMRLTKNTQALAIETKYLRELNSTYEKLQKSEQKAMHFQKLQTIGTLTGGIAHEFNNLLTPILGYCEIMLKEVPQDSELYEDISEIYKIARKAAELVKQILVFGRHEKGMHIFKPLDISTFVRESLKMIKKILPHSITFTERISPDCGFIYANATMINQIMMNLCTNAYQAMKETGGTLTIELEKVNKKDISDLIDSHHGSEAYVLLKVTDTGCGMDKDTVDRIFDPFFTTKRVGEGSGLGLWVVHSIVLEHKGEITVQSEKGKGSTFSIYFPWLAESANEDILDINSVKRRESISILLVEDEADIIKVLKKGLTQSGYIVDSDSKPASAISRFKGNPDKYDLVVTDYSMPGMTGLELAGEIKKIRDNIKVILITGFMEKNIEEIAENRLIDGYLLKPLSCDDLDKKIQTLFEV